MGKMYKNIPLIVTLLSYLLMPSGAAYAIDAEALTQIGKAIADTKLLRQGESSEPATPHVYVSSSLSGMAAKNQLGAGVVNGLRAFDGGWRVHGRLGYPSANVKWRGTNDAGIWSGGSTLSFGIPKIVVPINRIEVALPSVGVSWHDSLAGTPQGRNIFFQTPLGGATWQDSYNGYAYIPSGRGITAGPPVASITWRDSYNGVSYVPSERDITLAIPWYRVTWHDQYTGTTYSPVGKTEEIGVFRLEYDFAGHSYVLRERGVAFGLPGFEIGVSYRRPQLVRRTFHVFEANQFGYWDRQIELATTNTSLMNQFMLEKMPSVADVDTVRITDVYVQRYRISTIGGVQTIEPIGSGWPSGPIGQIDLGRWNSGISSSIGGSNTSVGVHGVEFDQPIVQVWSSTSQGGRSIHDWNTSSNWSNFSHWDNR